MQCQVVIAAVMALAWFHVAHVESKRGWGRSISRNDVDTKTSLLGNKRSDSQPGQGCQSYQFIDNYHKALGALSMDNFETECRGRHTKMISDIEGSRPICSCTGRYLDLVLKELFFVDDNVDFYCVKKEKCSLEMKDCRDTYNLVKDALRNLAGNPSSQKDNEFALIDAARDCMKKLHEATTDEPCPYSWLLAVDIDFFEASAKAYVQGCPLSLITDDCQAPCSEEVGQSEDDQTRFNSYRICVLKALKEKKECNGISHDDTVNIFMRYAESSISLQCEFDKKVKEWEEDSGCEIGEKLSGQPPVLTNVFVWMYENLSEEQL